MNLHGRTKIKTAVSEVNSSNIVQVISNSIDTFEKNRSEIQYLYEYYKGKQLTYREKNVRPEINNIVNENHAYEIINFKKGYGFSEPIQYVRNGSITDTSSNIDISESINTLNEYMQSEGKNFVDANIAEWCLIGGVGYRMTLPKEKIIDGEAPFEMECSDPRKCFVVYNNGFKQKPILGVKVIEKENTDKFSSGFTKRYCCYTQKEYFEIETNKIVKQEKHNLGYIPIQEYILNRSRLGAFELVIELLDAINNTASNRMDSIEQFVQSFVKFINCDIDSKQFEELKELGAIKVNSTNGSGSCDVDIISSELNQTQTQVFVEHMYNMVLIICGMPDRNGAGGSGDTGQAVILRDGWGSAEATMKDYETMFKECENEFLKYILNYLNINDDLKINLRDIDVKFSRNRTDNILTKSQSLQTMIATGVSPEIAFNLCGLFSDPESAYLDSMQYLEEKANGNTVQEVQQTTDEVQSEEQSIGNGNTDKVSEV